ncbi:MAG: BatA and WFA domain-containing protein [Clostridia bacterium]|nr:BatA and WFA domain-containing protein [Clostridia bacterium]
MRLENPAGLWLLLGIPALILIYMLRNRYEEKVVSGTYLWRLSRRFQKRRLPVQRFKKILLFILQLLFITTCALAASQPVLVEGEVIDYVAILDASASMQAVDEKGVSRFDLAKSMISDLANETLSGHTVSVITAGREASYLVQKSESGNEVRLALNHALCENGTANTWEALELAQMICDRSPNSKVILYTDTEYSNTSRIQVKNLNRGEWNVALTGMEAEKLGENVTFTATLVSYGLDTSVTCGIKVDGALLDAKSLDLTADTPATLEFDAPQRANYETAEVYFELDDALALDNSYALCQSRERTWRVALHSEAPLYLRSALEALGTCETTVFKSTSEESLQGFDLYIFDGIYPDAYPEDGSVLQFGTEKLPDGLTAAGRYSSEGILTATTDGEHPILQGFLPDETAVTHFAPLQGKTGWKSLLYCGADAVLASKEGSYGIVTTVVSFDLHDSNLPLRQGFLKLIQNIVTHSVPSLLGSTDQIAGTTVRLTLPVGAKSLFVEKPDGSIQKFPPTGASVPVKLDQIGVYAAVLETETGGEYTHFFAHVTEAEERCAPIDQLLEVDRGFAAAGDNPEATKSLWRLAALLLLLLILTEWGWYYYEER